MNPLPFPAGHKHVGSLQIIWIQPKQGHEEICEEKRYHRSQDWRNAPSHQKSRLLTRQGRLTATLTSPGNKSSDQFSCRLQAAQLSGAEGGVSEKLSTEVAEIKGIAKRYTCWKTKVAPSPRSSSCQRSQAESITESFGLEIPSQAIESNINSALSPPLYCIPKCHIHVFFECFQEWWFHHFPGQPDPVPDDPFSEKFFPNMSSKEVALLAQPEAISSCPESYRYCIM